MRHSIKAVLICLLIVLGIAITVAVTGADRWGPHAANPTGAPATAAGGATVRIIAPNTAFSSPPAFGAYSTPWLVLRPDGRKEECTPTIANCLDRVFADPAINNNWSYEIESGGGPYGSNNQVAINGTLRLPRLRSQHIYLNSTLFGGRGSGTSVMTIDSALNSDISAWGGGELSSTPAAGSSYTDSVLLIEPHTKIEPEGFPAISASTLDLPSVARDSLPRGKFAGGISGTALTYPKSLGLRQGDAVCQVVGPSCNGGNVAPNTHVTALGNCRGTSCQATITPPQTVANETLTAFPVVGATVHVSTAHANVIAATIKIPEINGAGAYATPLATNGLSISGATKTTGFQNNYIHILECHLSQQACIQEGASTSFQSALHDNIEIYDQISPGNGGGGIDTFGSHDVITAAVDDNAAGAGGTVAYGIRVEPGADKNIVTISCRATGRTIAVCAQLSAGSSGNIVYVTTEGNITSPVLDQSGCANTIVVNGILQGCLKSWTPTLAFGGNSAGIAGTFTGIYEQPDSKHVVASFSLALTSRGRMTGAATIGGLPASANKLYFGACSIAWYNNMRAVSGTPWGQARGSSIALDFAGATGTGALSDANFTDKTVLQGTCNYLTN